MQSDRFPAATEAIVAAVATTPPAQALRERLEQGGAVSCLGVATAAMPFLAALVRHLCPGRPVVLVTEGVKSQESCHQDLQTWLKPEAPDGGDASPGARADSEAPGANCVPLLYYPAWEVLPRESKLPHVDVISERLETLAALADADGTPGFVLVTTVVALLQKTFSPAALRARLRTLKRGDTLDPLDLIEWLEEQAYEPEAQVTQKGELALRGGIVDVFPVASPWPVRLEFFGNELESLRYFDPQTQLSRQPIERVTLSPVGELGLLRHQMAAPPSPGVANASPAEAGASAFVPVTVLDYLPPNTLVLLSEPAILARQAGQYEQQTGGGDPLLSTWAECQRQMADRGFTVLGVTELEDPHSASRVGAALVDESEPGPAPAREPSAAPLSLALESLDAFRPVADHKPEPQVAATQRREFFGQLHRWVRQGYGVHVFCNNVGERQRFTELWTEYGLGTESHAPEQLGGGPSMRLGALARGFLCHTARVAVVTDAEIFGRYKVQRPRRLKSPHAPAIRSALDIDFTDFEEGDYVVHVQHGIGRYLGLQLLPPAPGRRAGQMEAEAGGVGQECLAIEYAPGDPDQPPPRLYVPITEAHLVSKYVGAGQARPPLNTLGGGRWAKTKAAATEAVRDLAAELLGLQAARAARPGFAFPRDLPWQGEFESAFVYEETPDQLRAIAQVKADLEAPKPMDRLICGDVGFGKTEVAIRAAFKAVLAGKQVAVLVPTTVLAQQHFNTFSERMADYPVRVELLSRFRTRRQQARVIEDLAAGAVDIVIGTHRLVQGDVQFRELGLVIIDEEQRFGVLDKERLKQLRQLVDVLTLSATPIPRTLYFALTGARDMSTIETPPQDRLPVETIIAAYDERLIRDAIQRELNRGGQVFYLHNRVLDIESVAERLRRLVPEARLETGHGQMHADDLEEVMTRFVNGKTDVLLSTTIIESGIDIPNANTIIIDRADRFGLSDLYQLRGRVGRYKHQAYAYLLLPRHAGLLADARKRITAIKQFSSPGSGFKIAMRDLEIRGAGNLLGSEQSGHITAVGFDLYCQLLKRSIGALRGEAVRPHREVSVRLDFLDASCAEEGSGADVGPGAEAAPPPTRLARPAACLPARYIPEPRHRLELYRKLAQSEDQAQLEGLSAELRDRFGPLPPPVELLLQIAELRHLAGPRGVTAIETRDDKLILTRQGDLVQAGGKFPRLTRKEPKARLKEIRRIILAFQPVA